MLGNNVGIQSLRLTAKDQPILGLKADLCIGLGSPYTQAPEAGSLNLSSLGGVGEKLGPAVVAVQIDRIPIVQARPFEITIAEAKSQGIHQMEGRLGSGAGAGNIASVSGDLRGDQNHMNHNVTLAKNSEWRRQGL